MAGGPQGRRMRRPCPGHRTHPDQRHFARNSSWSASTEPPGVRTVAAARQCFERRYTGADIRLLAEVDAALGDMSGPATRAVMRREFEVFGQRRFERLARLSNGHLYNLRRSRTYQRKRTTFTKTRPTPVAIGERRKPRPDGQPGFLRDRTRATSKGGVSHQHRRPHSTAHRLRPGHPGFLLPVLEANLRAYPFPIQGFHTDNGSEYGSRRCSTSCISASSPSPAPASPTTTPSSRAKTPPSCANTSDTTTSPNASPPERLHP